MEVYDTTMGEHCVHHEDSEPYIPSCMCVEIERGWNDLASTIPHQYKVKVILPRIEDYIIDRASRTVEGRVPDPNEWVIYSDAIMVLMYHLAGTLGCELGYSEEATKDIRQRATSELSELFYAMFSYPYGRRFVDNWHRQRPQLRDLSRRHVEEEENEDEEDTSSGWITEEDEEEENEEDTDSGWITEEDEEEENADERDTNSGYSTEEDEYQENTNSEDGTEN